MTPPVISGSTAVPTLELREVVAVGVLWRGRVGLFRRSNVVAHDRGRWHCITGYVEMGTTPVHQALVELHEETGLGVADLDSFREGDVLELADDQGCVWRVHTFSAVSNRRRLLLNDEHDVYRWVDPRAVSRFSNRVDWLGVALVAAGVPGVRDDLAHPT